MSKLSFMAIALFSFMILCLTSCSKENSFTDDVAKRGGVTIKASIDAPTTRVAFEKEGNEFKMYWKDAADVEKYTLHYIGAPEATSYEFIKKSETTKVKSASFTCSTFPNVTNGSTVIYAVYPDVASNSANATTIQFNLNKQPGTQATTSSTDDVGNFNFMVAQSTVPENGLENISLSFKHKVALVKMELTFPDDVTDSIKNISINSADMHNKGTYILGTGNWDFTNDDKGSVSTMSGAKFALTNDHKITAWLAVFPERLDGVTITATAGSYTYYVDMSDVTFKATNVYEVTKTMTKRNFKSIYTVSDYYQWDAYSHYVIGNHEENNTNWKPGNEQFHYGENITAEQSCKDCISMNDLIKYINAGPVYWDAGYGDASNGLQTFITQKNDTEVGSNDTQENHSGIWLLKKSKWPANISGNIYTVTPESINEGNVSIRTSGNYFFLPDAGLYGLTSYKSDGSGRYWLSNTHNQFASILYFNSNKVDATITVNRNAGLLPFIAE